MLRVWNPLCYGEALQYSHVLYCYQPAPFDLSYHYVRIMYILALCIFIGPGMPFAFCTTWLSLVVQYRVDAWYFCTQTLPTPHQGQIAARAMPNLINRILKVFIFFHVVYALLWWQFTTVNFLDIAVNNTAFAQGVSDVALRHHDRPGPGSTERLVLALAPLLSLIIFLASLCDWDCISWFSWRMAVWLNDSMPQDADQTHGEEDTISRRQTTNLESFLAVGRLMDDNIQTEGQLDQLRLSTNGTSVDDVCAFPLANALFEGCGTTYSMQFERWVQSQHVAEQTYTQASRLSRGEEQDVSVELGSSERGVVAV